MRWAETPDNKHIIENAVKIVLFIFFGFLVFIFFYSTGFTEFTFILSKKDFDAAKLLPQHYKE
jgi:hypothetical protein